MKKNKGESAEAFAAQAESSPAAAVDKRVEDALTAELQKLTEVQLEKKTLDADEESMHDSASLRLGGL